MTTEDFSPPAALAAVIHSVATLAAANGRAAYVVGGTVRDVLLGRPAQDLDLAVTGEAAPFARRVGEALDGHFVELDEDRGIYRVVLRAPAPDGPMYIDVAAMQGTIDADLRRRDFTIDAMAVEVEGGDVIDPRGGVADLKARIVRMTDAAVFEADPLRLLRCARIAAELRFDVEATTAVEVRARAGDVMRPAGERQRDELARMFGLADAYGGVRLLDGLGLLDVVLPEVAAGRGVTQPPQWHAYDVFEHGMRAVEAMDLMLARERPASERAWVWEELWSAFAWRERELRAHLAEELSGGRTRASLLKLAALLHDVGKPQSRTVDETGRIRFFGHADGGATIAARIMRRLRFSAAEVRYVSLLVAEHLRPVQLAQVGEAPTKRALYRFNRALGDAMPDVLLLALADAAGSRGPALTSDGWLRHVAYMNSLLVRSMEGVGILHAPPLLTGDEVMAEGGIAPGPMVGRLLEALREAEAIGAVTTADGARAFVRRLVRDMKTTRGNAGAGEG